MQLVQSIKLNLITVFSCSGLQIFLFAFQLVRYKRQSWKRIQTISAFFKPFLKYEVLFGFMYYIQIICFVLFEVHNLFDQFLFCSTFSLICQAKNIERPTLLNQAFPFTQVILKSIYSESQLLSVQKVWWELIIIDAWSIAIQPAQICSILINYASTIPRYSFGMISRPIFELLKLLSVKWFLVIPCSRLFIVFVWSLLTVLVSFYFAKEIVKLYLSNLIYSEMYIFFQND